MLYLYIGCLFAAFMPHTFYGDDPYEGVNWSEAVKEANKEIFRQTTPPPQCTYPGSSK